MNQGWVEKLRAEMSSPYFRALNDFVASERTTNLIFPADDEILRSLSFLKPEETKVVIIGQDPYHGLGQAHGLSFSVPNGVALPPSLRNIFKELSDDCEVSPPTSGDLSGWAAQGVLLLNTTLTVRLGEPGSHIGRGWEQFTDHIIRVVNDNEQRCVFVLWGAYARSKRALVTATQHVVIESAHPSPLSAYRGFFGSRPFTRANQALIEAGRAPIDWMLNNREH
jgi:uracil-DNA glycosylase